MLQTFIFDRLNCVKVILLMCESINGKGILSGNILKSAINTIQQKKQCVNGKSC